MAKVIKVDFTARGKELRRLQAQRTEEIREARVERRIRRAIRACMR